MLEIIMPAGMSLKTMNLLVAQLEGADGPLTGMRMSGHSTILLFDETAPKPASFAVIGPHREAPAQRVAGVCSGRIFVEGTAMDCVAHRAHP